MKRSLIVGIFIILIALLLLLISINAFKSKDWIMQKLKGTFNGEENIKVTENEKKSSDKELTINSLIMTLSEETNASEGLKELQKTLIFPQGAYLDGYHVQSYVESLEGELSFHSELFSYEFRIIIPKEKTNEFVHMLTENNLYNYEYPNSIPSTFEEINSKDLLYAFTHLYGFYLEGHRTTGVISIYIIESDDECIVLITA